LNQANFRKIGQQKRNCTTSEMCHTVNAELLRADINGVLAL